jgi:hypothetical protein
MNKGKVFMSLYKLVAPVYTQFLDRSISATRSVSQNSEGHMESVQPSKCKQYMGTDKVIFAKVYVRFYLFLKLQFLLRFLDSLKKNYFVCLQFNKHNSY